MTLQYLQSHAAGILKLVPPFWGKPRIAAWLFGYLNEIQALEDAIWSFIVGIDVDTAERFALEGLAKIVGEKRRPASTDTLRVYVQARIAANKSDGTPGAIATVIALLSHGTVLVLSGNREIRVMQLTGPDPADFAAASALLDAACKGGVHGIWLPRSDTCCVRPGYGETPDDTRRRGFAPRINYYG